MQPKQRATFGIFGSRMTVQATVKPDKPLLVLYPRPKFSDFRSAICSPTAVSISLPHRRRLPEPEIFFSCPVQHADVWLFTETEVFTLSTRNKSKVKRRTKIQPAIGERSSYRYGFEVASRLWSRASGDPVGRLAHGITVSPTRRRRRLLL